MKLHHLINALVLAAATAIAAEKDSADRDLALEPAVVTLSPRDIPPTKRQGVPGIECTAKGRLWAIYGREVEGSRTFQVVRTSADDGRSWSDVKLMIQAQRGVRAMSASIWIDPQGRLWVFWGQTEGMHDDRYGVWAIVADNPELEDPKWSAPRRLGDGVLLNKPTVLANGDWLLPAYIGKTDNSLRVHASSDRGATFQLRGTANVLPPESRGPDEPMIVQRKDGSLWMLVRSLGIKETTSTDGGRTWSSVERTSIRHPTSRFFIRRLTSGNLLLIKHGALKENAGRSKLTAVLSEDDGKTWIGGLTLDERVNVTYPDGAQAADGTIYVAYDYNRTPDGAVLLAAFTEADVRAGHDVSGKVRLRMEISSLGKK